MLPEFLWLLGRHMAQDVHIKLALLVPKICDAKNQDTYYNAFIDGSTQW